LRTLGAFAEALKGELQIRIVPMEEASAARRANYHAYSGYETSNCLSISNASETGPALVFSTSSGAVDAWEAV
jgi:hypothetical protein